MSRTVRRTLAVIAVIASCTAGAIVRGADTDLSNLEQRVGRLEALTQRVEAISAIKRLQHAYGHYSELGLWHDFADLFADTGIGYYTQGALDREGIRQLFLKEVGGGRVGLADGRIYPHISMQPVVTLAPDGQSGKGRWHIMAMLGGYNANASWAGGVYDNQYERENGVWKFKEVRFLTQYSGRYDAPGWTPTKDNAPFDFDDSRAGAPIFDVPDPAATGQLINVQTFAALAKRMANISARAARLTDEIAVTNLQHAYGYSLDRKMWNDVAELFASDGTREIGLQGVYVGRSSIRRGLNAFGKGLADGEVNDHVHLQTIVTVSPDGRTARARGTELGMIGPPSSVGSGGASTPRALLTQSIYENEFVKQGNAWKFKAMHVYPRFIVDAAQGWGKSAIPAPGPSREFPPDRPSTETYEIFPRFHIAPLHFDHPVTGRPARYPASAEATAGKPASSTVVSGFSRTPVTPAPVKTAAALDKLLASTERAVQRSQAYHASENLATAYGYSEDKAAWNEKRFTLHQVVQPVITVSADGRGAKIRARLFQMGNAAGGEGVWTSGIYEGTAAHQSGAWKLSGMNLTHRWTAPSRGGWASD